MNTRTTQIRIPESIAPYIESKAAEFGISKNAMMLVLMKLGRRVFEANLSLSAGPEPTPWKADVKATHDAPEELLEKRGQGR